MSQGTDATGADMTKAEAHYAWMQAAMSSKFNSKKTWFEANDRLKAAKAAYDKIVKDEQRNGQGETI